MTIYTGKSDATGLKFGIAVARFNDFITERLLEGAKSALQRCGAKDDDIDVAWVPGSFELPVVALRMAKTGRYAAVICLGAVIRGETPHFDLVANEAAKGISRASMDTGVPVIFGVLATETTQQAIERAGVKSGNKGSDAGYAAVEMAQLLKALPPAAQK